MLDVENCGNWVSKRNFKVENFLLKHLQSDSGCTRYYETCVIDRKGSLLLRNIILTDQSVLFTENPPKSFVLSIRFSDIQNISVVADRKTLIKGGNNNSYICQHVRLFYKASKEKKVKKESANSKVDSKIKILLHQHHETEIGIASNSSYESLSRNGSEFSSNGTHISLSTSSPLHNKNTISDSSDFTDVSRESSSLDCSYIPMSLYHAYESVVIAPDLRSRTEISKSSSAIPLLLHRSNLKLSVSNESVRSNSSSSGSLIHPESKQKHSNKIRNESSRGRNVIKGIVIDNSDRPFRDESESRSDDYSDLETGRESLYGNFKREINSQSQKEHKNRQGLLLYSSPFFTRGVMDSRANSGLEQRSSSTRDLKSENTESLKNKNNLEELQNKRRPRSVDISQLSNFKEKLFGKVFRKEKETTVGVRGSGSKSTGSTPQLISQKDQNDFYSNSEQSTPTAEDDFDQEGSLQILNVYLYQPNSALLNELFLFWNRHYLKCTLQMEEFGSTTFRDLPDGTSSNNKSTRSLHAAEKVFSKLSRTWSPVDSSIWMKTTGGSLCFPVILPKLGTLHKALMKHDHLKRICWKNWNMIVNLLGLLRRCMTKLEEKEIEEDEDYFLDKISAYAVIMDIFRLLYEASGTSWFIEESKTVDLTNNNNYSEDNYENYDRNGVISNESIPSDLHQLTSILVQIILESAVIPHTGISGQKELIKMIVCSPQKFANGRWLHYPDSKAIKAITMAHNASVALLHEILSIVHFSSKDNERAKFMSYLQHCPMETYVKLSVTQVINFLWSNGRPAGSSQAVLLYRHVSTLQTLFQTVSYLKSFVKDSFCEEFRYFIHRKSAQLKIPDRFPLKPKLLTICEKLRQEIIGK